MYLQFEREMGCSVRDIFCPVDKSGGVSYMHGRRPKTKIRQERRRKDTRGERRRKEEGRRRNEEKKRGHTMRSRVLSRFCCQ